MLVHELDEAVQKERVLGRCPVFVNGMAGTTVLGAIDDLEAVADVCQKHGVWMHVDVSVFDLFHNMVLHGSFGAWLWLDERRYVIFFKKKLYNIVIKENLCNVCEVPTL